jgi:hypothetical protein
VEVAVEYLQDAGKQWLLTFPPSMANVAPLQLNTTRLLGGNYTAEVTELRNGTAFLGGHFALALGASASYALPHNASAAQVQHAAAGLYNWTGLVQVQRTELDVDSFEWAITFPASAGDVQGFRVAAAGLTGTQAAIEDWTAVNGSYTPLGGNFTLGFDNGYTHTLPFNASAVEVQEALRNATSVGNITVSREDYVDGATGYGGFAWRVSFSPLGEPSYPGTVPLIQIGDFSLEGVYSSPLIHFISHTGSQLTLFIRLMLCRHGRRGRSGGGGQGLRSPRACGREPQRPGLLGARVRHVRVPRALLPAEPRAYLWTLQGRQPGHDQTRRPRCG